MSSDRNQRWAAHISLHKGVSGNWHNEAEARKYLPGADKLADSTIRRILREMVKDGILIQPAPRQLAIPRKSKKGISNVISDNG